MLEVAGKLFLNLESRIWIREFNSTECGCGSKTDSKGYWILNPESIQTITALVADSVYFLNIILIHYFLIIDFKFTKMAM